MGKAGWAVLVILGVFVSSLSWAVNGDMGVGTEPLTNGSEAYPWLIEDLADFEEFCSDVTYWSAGVYTRLEVDLDLVSGGIYSQAPIAGCDCYISFSGTRFNGNFEGNHHVIRNLRVNTGYYAALFGCIGVEGAVTDLGVENASISGSGYVGCLCGWNNGIIVRCHSSGSINGDEIVGGLCGRNYGTIINSFSTANISGEFAVGGLCGFNVINKSITNCYCSGMVTWITVIMDPVGYIGGLCGGNDGNITHCYSASRVNITGFPQYFGGLCGRSYGTFTGCFWDIDTSLMVDGVGNQNPDPAGVIGKTMAEMKTPWPFMGVGWDFVNENAYGTSDFWRMCVAMLDYPRLSWESEDGDFACPDGVGFEDLEHYAGWWLGAACNASNNRCAGSDVDYSGEVGLIDFAIFAAEWMRL